MKRRLILLVILLAIIAGAYGYNEFNRPTEIVLTGIVTTDDVIVAPQIQGRLEKLLVKQGDTVKEGDLIAVIHPDQWQADMSFFQNSQEQAATQVSQAEADWRFTEYQTQSQIAQAQANADSADAQVKAAQADQENAHLTLTRTQEMFDKGVESQQALDDARTGFDASAAKLQSVQKQAAAAQAAIAVAKSNLEQVTARHATIEMMQHQLAAAGAQTDKAKIQLSYTQIVAPLAGTVDVRAALQGEVVSPGQAIITIVNPDDLWVRADVEESYIDRIHLGDILTVRLPSGKELQGTVFYRSVDADYATQRDVSRTKRDIKTFEVRLRCDNADRALALGMTASVVLPLEKK